MKKTLLFLAIVLPLLSVAQSEYTFMTFRKARDVGYNFWLSVPDSYEAKKDSMPVIVFLHGASLCGSDMNRVRKYGCLDAISMGRDIDALIIAPQNPGGAWSPLKIMNVLHWVQERYAMDTNRIYVIGMSLGGYGTFDLVNSYPDKFAAAMALCGGSAKKEFCNLNKLPLWIIHGTADRAVPISQSDRIVKAMKTCGPTDRLRYDRFAGVNHSQLAKIFYLNQTYEWLLSHSKADSARQVNKEVCIDTKIMSAAYQNIDRSANKIVVQKGSSTPISATTADTTTVAITDTTSAVTGDPSVEPEEVVPEKEEVKTTPTVHIVRKGDTLYAIARKYRTTVAKLCQLNHIKENSILSLGQKIKVR